MCVLWGHSIHSDADLIKFFKATLDFTVLAGIFSALLEFTVPPAGSPTVAACNLCVRILRAVTQSNRFSFTFDCLSAAEKGTAHSLLDAIDAVLRSGTDGLDFTAENVAQLRSQCV